MQWNNLTPQQQEVFTNLVIHSDPGQQNETVLAELADLGFIKDIGHWWVTEAGMECFLTQSDKVVRLDWAPTNPAEDTAEIDVVAVLEERRNALKMRYYDARLASWEQEKSFPDYKDWLEDMILKLEDARAQERSEIVQQRDDLEFVNGWINGFMGALREISEGVFQYGRAKHEQMQELATDTLDAYEREKNERKVT
jgi:hypothetical protein